MIVSWHAIAGVFRRPGRPGLGPMRSASLGIGLGIGLGMAAPAGQGKIKINNFIHAVYSDHRQFVHKYRRANAC